MFFIKKVARRSEPPKRLQESEDLPFLAGQDVLVSNHALNIGIVVLGLNTAVLAVGIGTTTQSATQSTSPGTNASPGTTASCSTQTSAQSCCSQTAIKSLTVLAAGLPLHSGSGLRPAEVLFLLEGGVILAGAGKNHSGRAHRCFCAGCQQKRREKEERRFFEAHDKHSC